MWTLWKDYQGCFEEETEYVGHDIPESVLQTENPMDCHSECVKDETCNAWTYIKNKKNCLLKYTKDEIQTGNANHVSGPKICKGIHQSNKLKKCFLFNFEFRFKHIEENILWYVSWWQAYFIGG